MYHGSSPALPAAITAAGSMGFLSVGWDTPEQLEARLSSIRKSLNIPRDDPLPIGIGFLVFILDNNNKNGVDDPCIQVALSHKPSVIMLAFSNDLGKYVTKIREVDSTREHKTKIFMTVNSVEEAKRAVYAYKVDAIVVQGGEAGGHSGGHALPMFPLLQAVLSAIPHEHETSPLIVAAGGIYTGAQAAAVLTLGADGCLVGTRFIGTKESSYSDAAKKAIIDADFMSTAKNRIFDQTSKSDEWPLGVEGRAIANDVLTDYHGGLSLLDRVKNHDEALERGDNNRLVIWAGLGIGQIKEVEAASTVLQGLHEDCIRTLKKAHTSLAVAKL